MNKNCGNCAHRYVCIYNASMIQWLRDISRQSITGPATELDMLRKAIERTKAAIGADCKYYLKQKGGK